MKRWVFSFAVSLLGCTYDPPTRSADFYENPETYQDQSATHPGRARFQAYLDAAVGSGLPGAVFLVRTPADGTWAGAAGYADLANDVPWTPSMIGRAGSITKTFTAALSLKLLEEHGISLDSLAKPWLPKQVRTEIENADRVSFAQLLNQTSGLYPYLDQVQLFFAGAGSYDFPYHTKEEFLEYAYGQPAEYGPGNGWNYSDTNFLLLEIAAERLAGLGSVELMNQRLISELGLRSTFYDPAAAVPRGLARGYADLFADERLIDVTDNNLERFHFDGGVISNVYDLADLLDALLSSDYLSASARAALLDGVSTRGNSDKGTDFYGAGMIIEQHPELGPVFGHSGSSLGFTAHVYHVESAGITFAAIVNASQKNLERRSYDWFSPLKSDRVLRVVMEQ
jgi:D-alanyl-D-alanine carboxypeptidase